MSRRFGIAGRRGARRRPARPRFLRDFAVGSADPVAGDPRPARAGGGGRFRRGVLQPALDAAAPGSSPKPPKSCCAIARRTPRCLSARNLGRDGETTRIAALSDLAGDNAEIDMLSVVMVGNSTSRVLEGYPSRLYTPRGYFPDTAEVTVHFIGAGPGAPDLITVRGLRLIERCPVCLYAGSLVPREILAAAPPDACIIDTAPLTLDEIVAHIADAHTQGLDVARLHSGDPSLYGAIAEQMRRLDALGIPYDVTPGVPSFAAAAAALGCELTLPEIVQTVILTRTATRSSPMPDGERLEKLAATGATLAIHLSVDQPRACRSRADPILRRRLPGGRRLPRQLARPAADPRHSRRHP